jgi:hypothetical protein
MGKTKAPEKLPDFGNKLYELIKQGYKIYPIYHKYKWWIEYEYKGEITRFTKPIAQGEITSAINKTIIHLHKTNTNDKKRN